MVSSRQRSLPCNLSWSSGGNPSRQWVSRRRSARATTVPAKHSSSSDTSLPQSPHVAEPFSFCFVGLSRMYPILVLPLVISRRCGCSDSLLRTSSSNAIGQWNGSRMRRFGP
eukprot:scaffold7328_cov314-Pinguiococcus_pyrenoidosus.AAC.8